MDEKALRDTLLDVIESSLEAQLRAVRRLRSSPQSSAPTPDKEGMSQLDMAYAILKDSPAPLHISQILDQIASRFDQIVDRESLVSALAKRIARRDRFQRTDKNTFTLLPHS